MIAAMKKGQRTPEQPEIQGRTSIPKKKASAVSDERRSPSNSIDGTIH